MKIGKFQRPRQRVLAKKSGQHSLSIPHSAFLETLQEKQGGSQEIAVVIEQIDEYARQLRHSPTFDHLRVYKRAVRQLLKHLVEQSYSVSERIFYDRIGQRRLFLLIDQIDQKIEELTRSFMASQARNIDLAQRLDEIRGMLLDLYS